MTAPAQTLPAPSATPSAAQPAANAPADEFALLRALRAFHLTGAAAGARPQGGELLPPLVLPFRDEARVRTDYPLVIAAADGALTATPLRDELLGRLDEFAPGGARILRDNLDRLERLVRTALAERRAPAHARPVLAEAGAAMEAELQLKGENAAALKADLESLVAKVSTSAHLLGFHRQAGLWLFIEALRAAAEPRRAAFSAEVRKVCDRIEALLKVERAKDPQARAPDAVQASLGAWEGIDAAALSRVLGEHRGTVATDPERRRRLEESLEVLSKFTRAVAEMPWLVLVASGGLEVPDEAADGPGVRLVRAADPCAVAAEEFDAAAVSWAEVARAVRSAKLELDGAYDPSLHDAWLASLGWTAFSEGELSLLPAVLALDTGAHLCREGLRSLSQLLRSGRPVKVMVDVAPSEDPAGAGVGAGVRFELGYFGISHREAVVHQSTAARPAHLVRGFLRALASQRPSLHVLATWPSAARASRVGGFLHMGAAIDGRAHPLFLYSPEAGATWARRFELDGNAQPDAEWPVGDASEPAKRNGSGGEPMPFTFGDFALLEPAFDRHLLPVPEGVPDAELAPLVEWLRLAPDEAARRVPFVWGADASARRVKVALTRELAFAARDRLSFWRTLQEWAGLQNEHVERAVAAARAEADAQRKAELDRLQAEHAAEVEKVRNEAAGEAMKALAATLLDLDPGALPAPSSARATAAAPSSSAAAPAPTAASAASAPAAAAPAADDAMSFDDPFIDTPLCTSCNDCMAVNPLLFVYDSNKQARIGDLSKATFEHLVRAAEKCPARCIHPGKPKNPAEPNLEALIARAAPFN